MSDEQVFSAEEIEEIEACANYFAESGGYHSAAYWVEVSANRARLLRKVVRELKKNVKENGN